MTTRKSATALDDFAKAVQAVDPAGEAFMNDDYDALPPIPSPDMDATRVLSDIGSLIPVAMETDDAGEWTRVFGFDQAASKWIMQKRADRNLQDGDFVVQFIVGDRIYDEEWFDDEEKAVHSAKRTHITDGERMRVLTRDGELVYERKALDDSEVMGPPGKEELASFSNEQTRVAAMIRKADEPGASRNMDEGAKKKFEAVIQFTRADAMGDIVVTMLEDVREAMKAADASQALKGLEAKFKRIMSAVQEHVRSLQPAAEAARKDLAQQMGSKAAAAKQAGGKLLADTVLRRDAKGQLYLMNNKDKGWASWAMPVKSIEDCEKRFECSVGAWSKDQHSEFAPVTAHHGTVDLTAATKTAKAFKFKAYVGPTGLKDLAKKFEDAGQPVHLIGTEHLYFRVEGESAADAEKNLLDAAARAGLQHVVTHREIRNIPGPAWDVTSVKPKSAAEAARKDLAEPTKWKRFSVTKAVQRVSGDVVATNGRYEVWAHRWRSGDTGRRRYIVHFDVIEILDSTPGSRKVRDIPLPVNIRSNLDRVIEFLNGIESSASEMGNNDPTIAASSSDLTSATINIVHLVVAAQQTLKTSTPPSELKTAGPEALYQMDDDPEPFTLQDFMSVNSDTMDTDDVDIKHIAGLQIGESCQLGGGAFAEFTIRRIASTSTKRLTGSERDAVADKVWAMYQKSYEKIGQHVTSKAGLLAYDVWDVLNDDSGPVAFNVYKTTPFGLKVGLLGTDGSAAGKSAAKQYVTARYDSPGVYGEVSHALEKLSSHAPVVCAVKVADIIGKPVEVLPDGVHYKRDLPGVGIVTKKMVGSPRGVESGSGDNCPVPEEGQKIAPGQTVASVEDHDTAEHCGQQIDLD